MSNEVTHNTSVQEFNVGDRVIVNMDWVVEEGRASRSVADRWRNVYAIMIDISGSRIYIEEESTGTRAYFSPRSLTKVFPKKKNKQLYLWPEIEDSYLKRG